MASTILPPQIRRLRSKKATNKKKKSPLDATTNKDQLNATDSDLILSNLFRLSTDDVSPSHYTICIKPSLEEFTFEGCVSVNLDIKNETKYILMNAIDMSITKVMWEEDVTENKQEPMEFYIDPEKQILKIYFDPPLLPQVGCIRVNFNGIINTKLVGLYRSKYTTHGHGTTKKQSVRHGETADDVESGVSGHPDESTLIDYTADAFHIVTKFEPTYARMCFPCFDDPNVKCTFDLSLIVPKSATAISNMPIKITYEHRSKPHLHIVEFQRTPLMSTYLLAFAVGHFDFIEMIIAPDTLGPTNSIDVYELERSSATMLPKLPLPPLTSQPVPIRVYTVPEKQGLAEFALSTCVKLIKFYSTYFNYPYPLPKLDLVAVPEFITGGCENWGLITFKESRLLLHENDKGFQSLKKVAIIIAHELAHQWFGNLVTMEWWTHLWLSEGFATYMEFIAIDHLFPDYGIWNNFYTDTFLEVLKVDGLKNSHALEIPITNPNEIKENFDNISYDKGASILSMLKHFIGDEAFRLGLLIYLHKYAYRNSNSAKVWKCFERASGGKPIGAIMSSWTKRQMGYPLIRIVSSKWENNSRIITLTQEKFWSDPTQVGSRIQNKDYLWSVPLTFAIGSAPSKIVKEVLMDKRSLVVVIPNIPKSQWFKLNPGGIGYYRVKYLPELMLQFHQCIRNRSMPPLDRIGILNDLYAFVQAGLNSVLEIFNLLEAYFDEDNYKVWTQVISVLDSIDHLLWDTEYYDKFHIYCQMTLNSILDKVGWNPHPGEDSSKLKLRALVLSRMVLARHEPTLTTAEQYFRNLNSTTQQAPFELRTAIYQGGLVQGNQGEILNQLITRYKKSDSLEDKECIIHSLNAISDPDLINEVLEFAKSEFINPPEMYQIIKVLASIKAGRDMVWLFFRAHHAHIKSLYSPGTAYTQLVQAVTENFTTDAKAIEIHEFFKDKFTHPGLERTVLQVEEKIHINEAWLKRESALIEDYLSTYE